MEKIPATVTNHATTRPAFVKKISTSNVFFLYPRTLGLGLVVTNHSFEFRSLDRSPLTMSKNNHNARWARGPIAKKSKIHSTGGCPRSSGMVYNSENIAQTIAITTVNAMIPITTFKTLLNPTFPK